MQWENVQTQVIYSQCHPPSCRSTVTIFNIFKVRDARDLLMLSLYHFSSFISCHLLFPAAIFLSFCRWIYWLICVAFLCSPLPSLLATCCCCSALSASGSAEKLTEAALPDFTGRHRARGSEVGILTFTSTSTADGWRGGWKEGGASTDWRYIDNKSYKSFSLHIITTLVYREGVSDRCIKILLEDVSSVANMVLW